MHQEPDGLQLIQKAGDRKSKPAKFGIVETPDFTVSLCVDSEGLLGRIFVGANEVRGVLVELFQG